MIIDAHAHVHPDAAGLGAGQDASVERFLAELDASPLDRIILLPIDPVIPNEFIFETAKLRPDKIICFGSADPNRGRAAVELLERLAAEHSIRGLKLHPRRQHFSGTDFEAVRCLVERAADLSLPVLIDAFPYGRGALKDDTLELIEALSEAVPKAALIIAHMGGVRILDALILARTSYTIYLDLSLIYPVYRGSHIEQDIFYAIRRIGPERCIYGSDYPDVALGPAYAGMREALDAHGFSSSDQDWIFGKTAAHVLRLEGAEQ